MSDLVLENYINGEFVPCEKHIDSYDPSTGKVYCKVPDSGQEEVEQAVRAAKKAFTSWSVTTPSYRAAIMCKIADLIEAQLEEFAEAESKDQGKPVSLARTVDIPRACLNFRYFASSVITSSSLNSSSVLDNVGAVNYMIRTPVGVAGQICPWNLPLYLLTFKVAPAIAAGCTVVCKSSEMTSVTAWMMAKVMNEAGLPPGVCNLVFGLGPKAGLAIVKHPDVSVISFTGSTATGEVISKQCAPYCKKVSLELGGKNAAIIFDDTDLKKCVADTVRSTFSNQGEICLCTSRVFVQRGIYDRFLETFVEQARKLKVGPPKESETNIGALISKEHLAKVKSYVHLARQDGGVIVCGEGKDQPPDLPAEYRKGYFMQPTVITGLADNSSCMQEEIFGPVVSVVPFDEEEEVIQRANGVKYGLAASVWTQNLSRAHRVSQKLQVGTVWCNCWMVRDLNMPFGGTKLSGIGSEGGKDSYEFYTEPKTICIKL